VKRVLCFSSSIQQLAAASRVELVLCIRLVRLISLSSKFSMAVTRFLLGFFTTLALAGRANGGK
jgi:hypothetical protein